MKAIVILAMVLFVTDSSLIAQKNCSTFAYEQKQTGINSISAIKTNATVTSPVQNNLAPITEGTGTVNIITIPVVVHVLYHTPNQKISDALIIEQIKTLNKCFRRQNADSANTPAVFKPLAADCEIEFKLATSDPQKRNTTGIVKKYTPVTNWVFDDKMKFSS